MTARIVAVICVAVSAGLMGGSYFLGPGEEVIPWRDTPITEASVGPPDPLPRRIPDTARTCRARDVSVELVSSGPLNSAISVHGLELRNVSTQTCVVRSRPRAVVARNGPVRISHERRQTPFALWPGGAAGTEFFASDCDEPLWAPRRWALIRAGYLTRTATLRMKSCNSGTPGLVVLPFAGPPPPEPTFERFPLRATTHVPKRARAGELLTFLVELENTSSKPFRFPYCPIEEFGVIGVGRFVRELNCHPAGEIEPGGHATFELHAPLLREAPRGRAEVYWHMDDGTLSGSIGARDAIELR